MVVFLVFVVGVLRGCIFVRCLRLANGLFRGGGGTRNNKGVV